MNTLFFLFILFFFNTVSSFDFPNRFTKSSLTSSLHHKPSSQKYFELALPLPSDRLTSSCTLPILRHSFANTIDGPPFSTPYSPPSDCPSPWSFVVVEFRAKCKGEQYDRISALWLGGVEILRTSPAEPTEGGIFWKVRKDVTRYSSILSRSDLDLTIMLENVVDKDFTGIYHVEVNFLYYKDNVTEVRVPSTTGDRNESGELGFIRQKTGLESSDFGANLAIVEEEPADLIIPISDSGERGFWFRSESELDLHAKEIRFPKNTRRAVLELYVSFHGNDEFWYSNPPNSYVAMNNLETARANGAYREVFVTIDGELVGSEVPFPVFFTGGINPLFWEPVVAIGAFNLPTYDLELTPFLGKLLDKNVHRLGIGVSDGISYWLVNANLHLWLDHKSPSVVAQSSFYLNPLLQIERQSQFRKLDGSFKTKAERTIQYTGWVKWSGGNHTTTFSQRYKLWNTIRFQNDGDYKSVKQKIKASREVKVLNDRGQVITCTSSKRKYPLRVITAKLPGSRKDTYMLVTNVSHSMDEKSFHGGRKRRLYNWQDSNGWMEVKGHSVVSGTAETLQRVRYRDVLGCYSRSVSASNGKLTGDNTTLACLSLASS
ncbi:hypothetical protein L484_006932 [Morus notabilis]|uniref:Peptide N-acetyl-beta-D-glucosaminyl asparaginase amidase A N-terminal domain-containing protein n=1 Tax=Morus notabilis TaxID=981085 RepID=W9QYS4_9ROSA|nr:peptide-N4-(N-acetyl-beta-glucosaminyl)asparagine amidase A [Morus notabilis]EXB29258.1 hypothetical protein L484_006932 [Morus notabilis]